MMGIISVGTVVTTSERHGRAKMTQPRGREWVTVIQSVSSIGWCVPPFIVVAGKFHLASWYHDDTVPRN